MQIGLNYKMSKTYVTLAERVKFAREFKRLTQQTLAKKAGLKQSDISKLETGRMHSTTAMIGLAKALECSVSWLDNGRGEPWILETDVRGSYTTRIPIIGEANLDDRAQNFVDVKANKQKNYIQYISQDADVFALQCVSQAMSPRIKQSEYVIVEPNHEVVNGDEVLIKDKQGHVMVKQYAYKRDRKYYLSSINENIAPFSIEEEKIGAVLFIAGYAKSS